MTPAKRRPSIERVARERFGYDQLRPGQEEAIRAVLDGHDTLVVMPTGSGKSAIYQIASLLLPGPTIIVSPLIALQRDQMEAIEEHDVGEAAVVNSTESKIEQRAAIEEFEDKEVQYLFLAPEQFHDEELLDRLREANPSLFVVDEAHCISEWGHDFRPEYLRLGAVAEALGHPMILALTATASPPVRTEIEERLEMREPLTIVRGFNRPNIWLGVEKFQDERAKQAVLLERILETGKPGIVYVATKKHAEEIAGALRDQGVKADFYHAGMSSGERTRVQEAFMADESEVMVATIAFGLGVDKPNVRFVFHYDISDSVDSYYQEIGRAGRDGEPARAILFYRPEDLGIHRFFAGGGKVDLAQMEQVAEALGDHDQPVDPKELIEETQLSQAKVTTALTRLSEAGAVETLPNGEVIGRERREAGGEAVDEAVRAEEHHRAFEQSRIDMMRGYAEVWDCRREYLLNYFGERFDPPCRNCDNCDAGLFLKEDGANRPFSLNSRVTHHTLGSGLVERYEGDTMVVLFDEVGYKTLDVNFILESNALTAAE